MGHVHVGAPNHMGVHTWVFLTTWGMCTWVLLAMWDVHMYEGAPDHVGHMQSVHVMAAWGWYVRHCLALGHCVW